MKTKEQFKTLLSTLLIHCFHQHDVIRTQWYAARIINRPSPETSTIKFSSCLTYYDPHTLSFIVDPIRRAYFSLIMPYFLSGKLTNNEIMMMNKITRQYCKMHRNRHTFWARRKPWMKNKKKRLNFWKGPGRLDEEEVVKRKGDRQ